MEIDPADAETWSQLGLAYLAAGNRESARAVAAELAGLDPERAADLRRRAGLDPPPADSHRHPAGVQGVAPGRAAP